jgi:hypothetical protein
MDGLSEEVSGPSISKKRRHLMAEKLEPQKAVYPIAEEESTWLVEIFAKVKVVEVNWQ